MSDSTKRASAPAALLSGLLATACGGGGGDGATFDDTSAETSALVTAQSWPQLMSNAVALTNGDPVEEVERLLRDQFASLSSALTVELAGGAIASADLGLAQLPLADPDTPNAVDYSCANGGSLAITVRDDVEIYDVSTANCALNANVHSGRYQHNGFGREGVSSNMQRTIFTTSDGIRYTIDGEFNTTLSRIGFAASKNWVDTAFSVDDGQSDTQVSGYAIESTAREGIVPNGPMRVARLDDGTRINYAEAILQATIDASFDVTAAWTQGERLSVRTSLSMDSSYAAWADDGQLADSLGLPNPTMATSSDGSIVPIYRYPRTEAPTQWTSGTVELRAADGSFAVLTPSVDELGMVEVQVNDEPVPVLAPWSDYQVSCTGNEQFSDCL